MSDRDLFPDALVELLRISQETWPGSMDVSPELIEHVGKRSTELIGMSPGTVVGMGAVAHALHDTRDGEPLLVVIFQCLMLGWLAHARADTGSV